MPYKVCLQCKTPNGPRALTCKNCGSAFSITISKKVTVPIETLPPDTTPKLVSVAPKKRKRHRKPKDDKPKIDLRAEFKRCFEKIDSDPTEQRLSEKYYNGTLETWRSIDGKYLIRFTPMIVGLTVYEYLDPYKLLIKTIGGYEPIGIRGNPDLAYFPSLKKAFVYYLKMVENGDKPVARLKKRIFRTRKKKK